MVGVRGGVLASASALLLLAFLGGTASAAMVGLERVGQATSETSVEQERERVVPGRQAAS